MTYCSVYKLFLKDFFKSEQYVMGSYFFKCFTLKKCFSSRLNTFRLWVVQLFAIIKEYETEFAVGDSIDANLCSMIEYKVNKSSSPSSFNDETENLNSLCQPVSYAMNYSMLHIAL